MHQPPPGTAARIVATRRRAVGRAAARRRRWPAARRPAAAPAPTSAKNSAVVSSAGTRPPANASSTSTSALASRSAATPSRPSTGTDPDARACAGTAAAPAPASVSAVSRLQHDLAASPAGWPRCSAPACTPRRRRGSPRAARPAARRARRRSLHVLEVQVGRVVEIDVGLPDAVDRAAASRRAGRRRRAVRPRRARTAAASRDGVGGSARRRDYGGCAAPCTPGSALCGEPAGPRRARRIAACRRRPLIHWSAACSKAATGSSTASRAAGCPPSTRPSTSGWTGVSPSR